MSKNVNKLSVNKLSVNKLSVIVPCYNEEEALPRFAAVTGNVLQELIQSEERVGRELEYEMVFVDDGSRDGTAEQMRQLAREDSHCRYVLLSRNFGKESAMYAGLWEAAAGGCDYCVIMDADLQHPPQLLPEMYRMVVEEGHDCCGGKREGREGDGVVRSLLSRLFYQVCSRLTRMNMKDGYGDFRMMNRTMVDVILEMKERNRYMKGIFQFVGFRTCWIPYENVERTVGKSKWNLKGLFAYALEGILAFSTLPLRVAGLLAVLLVLAGIASACCGAEFSVSLLLVLSGLQMGYLQIMGSYLARDYLENKQRPVYIVRERG